MPPLNSLRTFMLVARSLSFKEAADQLFLTPSAVSRQVQGLEKSLGKRLFNRGNRTISLTREGELLLSGTERAFAILESTLEELEPNKQSMALRVCAQHYFSNNWLFSRISEFLKSNPSVEIQFESSQTYQAFDEKTMDICIRFSPEKNESLHCEAFFPQQAILLAAPTLVDQHDLQKNLHRAIECEWLAVRSQPDLMQRWFNDQGIHSDHSQIFFDDAQAALIAAKEGVGIVLAAWPLVADLLTSNQLIQLGTSNPKFASDYYLTYPKSLANHQPLILFRDWLKQQALIIPID